MGRPLPSMRGRELSLIRPVRLSLFEACRVAMATRRAKDVGGRAGRGGIDGYRYML